MRIVTCGYSSIDIWIYFFGGGGGIFLNFFSYHIQYCFFCRPSDSSVSNPGPLQLVNRRSDALTTRLDLIRWIYLCHLIFILAWNFFVIIYFSTTWLSFYPSRVVPCVCEIIFLFLATWVAPLSSHFSTLGCWNLLSPGNFHLRAEGAEIRFREILCAILHFIIPFTKAPPPPVPSCHPTLTDYSIYFLGWSRKWLFLLTRNS